MQSVVLCPVQATRVAPTNETRPIRFDHSTIIDINKHTDIWQYYYADTTTTTPHTRTQTDAVDVGPLFPGICVNILIIRNIPELLGFWIAFPKRSRCFPISTQSSQTVFLPGVSAFLISRDSGIMIQNLVRTLEREI